LSGFCAALELIQLLMEYDVKPAVLEGLVRLLRPTTDDIQQQLDILNGQLLAIHNHPRTAYLPIITF